MKISPAALGTLAASAAAVTGAAVITWYSVDRALEARKFHAGVSPTVEESPIVEFGERVLETWTWIGMKTGVLQEPQCGTCGMG